MSKSWADILVEDHNTTERVFEAVLGALEDADGPPVLLLSSFREYAVEYVDGCHNQKEERHLFPLIESRGVPREGGPLAVMLSEHARSKEVLAKMVEEIDRYTRGELSVLGTLRDTISAYAELLKGHFWKETDILYPMAKRVMTSQDAEMVLRGIEATEAELGPDTRRKYYALAERIAAMGKVEDLSYDVPRDLIAAILNTLPVELSFVDEDDTVRYFSHEHHDKIFPRTRGAIGTKVQNCHPRKSLAMVNRILADFKAGKRDVAAFWIDFSGRKVHIRYFPVRDLRGAYRGCLEVVQDITGIQALEGQRVLLDEST